MAFCWRDRILENQNGCAMTGEASSRSASCLRKCPVGDVASTNTGQESNDASPGAVLASTYLQFTDYLSQKLKIPVL